MKPLKSKVSITLDADIIEKLRKWQKTMIVHSASMSTWF